MDAVFIIQLFHVRVITSENTGPKNLKWLWKCCLRPAVPRATIRNVVLSTERALVLVLILLYFATTEPKFTTTYQWSLVRVRSTRFCRFTVGEKGENIPARTDARNQHTIWLRARTRGALLSGDDHCVCGLTPGKHMLNKSLSPVSILHIISSTFYQSPGDNVPVHDPGITSSTRRTWG